MKFELEKVKDACAYVRLFVSVFCDKQRTNFPYIYFKKRCENLQIHVQKFKMVQKTGEQISSQVRIRNLAR